MDWENEIADLEELLNSGKDFDWFFIAKQISKLLDEYKNCTLAYRAICYIYEILAEKNYKISDLDFYESFLRSNLNKYKLKCNGDAAFLFFVGHRLNNFEWHWGICTDDCPFQETETFEFVRKAVELEPNNLVYQWLYLSYMNEKRQSRERAVQIIEDPNYISWLNSKGFPGKDMLEVIKHSITDY